jgi:hypothetical protein
MVDQPAGALCLEGETLDAREGIFNATGNGPLLREHR